MLPNMCKLQLRQAFHIFLAYRRAPAHWHWAIKWVDRAQSCFDGRWWFMVEVLPLP